MTTVRAELAAVLLQSKKYDEAAREYRALLARDADERRLSARARARARVGRTSARRGARAARAASEARAARDGRFAAPCGARRDGAESRRKRRRGSPSDATTRRIASRYARALAREHYDWLAVAQYDTLLVGGEPRKIPEPLVLRREQVNAYLDGRRSSIAGAARLARRAASRRRATRRAPRVGRSCSPRRSERPRRARSTTR